jgi:MGT family glycosyltransferase
LALARRLVERDHSIRVVGPASLRLRFEAVGCTFATYERVPNGVPVAAGTTGNGRLRAALMALELARAAPVFAFAEDILAELHRAPADALLVDFMLAGAIAAAERAGLPTAALMHTVYCLPAPGRPPFGPGFKARRGWTGRLRDAVINGLLRHTRRPALTDLNEARRRLGLAPVRAAAEQLERVSRVLVLTSEAFDSPPSVLPPNVRYIGPQLDGSRTEQANLPCVSHDRDPLVVVSFSTRFPAESVVQRVIDALAQLPVRGLVTLGPALAPGGLRVPPNVLIRSFMPRGAVLPHARLVITHAGLGTVMAALIHGVPLICMPIKNDQFENAARVVAAGAGRSLNTKVSRRALQRTILQVLNEPRFRHGAQRLAKTIDSECTLAIEELEAVANG